MTKEYKLTATQIVAIYEAGIERGNDEASSYEHGCPPRSKFYDSLEDVLIWGDGIITGDIEYDDKVWIWERFLKEVEE